MRCLVAILGSCLTAAVVAGCPRSGSAADPLDYRSGDTAPWLNPSVGEASAALPQTPGYGVAAESPRSKRSAPPPAKVGGPADMVSDPPDARRNAVPADYEKATDSLAVRLAAATEPVEGQVKKDLPATSAHRRAQHLASDTYESAARNSNARTFICA